MAFRSKKKAKAAQAAQAEEQPGAQASPPSTSSGFNGFDLQVFDGSGHPGTMSFRRDGKGNQSYRLRRGRDFRAKLPHSR